MNITLEAFLTALWRFALRGGRRAVPLRRPPWPRSWTFGIGDSPVLDAINVTRNVAEFVIRERGHRPININVNININLYILIY